MGATTKSFKEVILECRSEEEAFQLMKDYQKESFHFVSKKCVDPETQEAMIKLIRFQNVSKQGSLTEIWEEWVHQMICKGFSYGSIIQILSDIRCRPQFWKTHPRDHIKTLILNDQYYLKTEAITKNFYFIGNSEACISFWCAYQKEIRYIFKENQLFALVPEGLKNSFIDLSVSRRIEILSYKTDPLKNKLYKNILEDKMGLIFIEKKDLKNHMEFEDNKSTIVGDINSIGEISKYPLPSSQHIGVSCCLEDPSQDILKVLNYTLTHKVPIAFLWEAQTLGSILNPKTHVLRFLEDHFDIL